MSAPDQDPPSNGESVTIPIRRESAARAVHETRRSPRAGILGLIGVALVLFAIIFAVQALVVDKIPDMTQESLQAATERWQKHGPASYDLDIQIGGAQPGIVHVEVRDGAVTASTRDGLPTPEWTWDEWSVPGQFEMLEREFEFAADPQREMQAPPGARLWLRCEFDPELGYPRRFHRYVTGGAPEVYWRTTSFKPK